MSIGQSSACHILRRRSRRTDPSCCNCFDKPDSSLPNCAPDLVAMADPFDLPRLRLEGPESREKGPDVATRSKVSTPFAQQIWVSSPCGWLIAPLIEFTRGGTVWVDSINSSARFIIPEMNDRLPLPTLLSQVLVAFTIEFDNEAERRMPHRTSNHGSTPDSLDASWLVSLAMWENCMRFVTDEPITVGEGSKEPIRGILVVNADSIRIAQVSRASRAAGDCVRFL